MQMSFSTFGWSVSLATHAVLVMFLFVIARPAGPDSGPEEPAPDAEEARTGNLVPGDEPRAESRYAPLPDSERPFPEMRETGEPPPPPPVRTKAPAAKPVSAKPAAASVEAAPRASGETEIYVVKSGDTLTAIANRTGTTLADLAKLNKSTVKKLAKLWVGQKIRVPAKK